MRIMSPLGFSIGSSLIDSVLSIFRDRGKHAVSVSERTEADGPVSTNVVWLLNISRGGMRDRSM